MKRGFTLIELLAVILILGVIALIATPIVLNLVDDARTSADEKSVQMFIKAVNNTIVSERMKNRKVQNGEYEITSNGNLCLTAIVDGTCSDELVLNYEGKKVESGYVIIEDGAVSGLNYIKLGSYAYSGNINNLTSIKTNKSIKKTPDSCFVFDELTNTITNYKVEESYCTSDVVIPSTLNGKNVLNIGNEAFAEKSLTSLIISNGVISIGEAAFVMNSIGDLYIPDSVESIGVQAFNSSGITSVRLPSNIKIISQYSFEGNDIESLTIPSNIETIEEGAFEMSNIKNLDLSNARKLKTIGENAFYENNFTNLIIPSSVEIICRDAFSVSNIKNVDFSQATNLKIIDTQAFSGNDLTSVDIPNSVVIIGESAFHGNHISLIRIGSGIESIGKNAFSFNDEFESITIDSSESNVLLGESPFTYVFTICWLKDTPSCIHYEFGERVIVP